MHGTYCEIFCYEYELEIFHITENGVEFSRIIPIYSKAKEVITFTDYKNHDFLACILEENNRKITIWKLDNYKLDNQLSKKYYHERGLQELKKYEINGKCSILFCCTSDKMLKVWCILTKNVYILLQLVHCIVFH